MKPRAAFRLESNLVWIICLLCLGLSQANAQSVRGSRIREVAPKSIASPTPNPPPPPPPSPSPSVTPNPPPSVSPTLPVTAVTKQIFNVEPIRPDPINSPKVETQQPAKTGDDSNAQEPELNQGYKDALKEYFSAVRARNQAAIKSYEYNSWALETHRKAVFSWQLLSGRIIFVVVILLVLTGVCFSGIQFFIAMKEATRKQQISEASDAQDKKILRTTLKASLSGIEVGSSILGIIVLMISFLFFYLYVVYVCPITVISE